MTTNKRRLLQLVISVAFIVAGVLGLRALTASKPEMQKRRPPVSVPTVRAIHVTTAPHVVTIRGEGTVRPLREINLVPEVGGKVVHVSPSLVNGGEFSKGDTLLQIDPADYQVAVTLAEAKVKDAESEVELATAEAAAAQEEWRLLREETAEANQEPPPLVAKEPQLAAAEAKLEAARADLQKASLNLQRTTLKAPFEGRIGAESIDTGQYVSPGQALATLYSTEAAEIVLPMEDENLLWFDVPGFTSKDRPGSPAIVRARIAGLEQTWRGKVVRTEGKLDERTRMINVVVQVEKPYARKPPLAIGLFVSVDIQGRSLPEAALIPRSALHKGDMVWVVGEDGRLRFRRVDVARIHGDEVIVRSGLEDGEMLVITPLKAVTDGMAVRVAAANGTTGSRQ